LNVELRKKDWYHTVVPPEERLNSAKDGAAASRKYRPPRSDTGKTCTGWGSDLVPPQTIKVLFEGNVEQRDFMFYVKHVLPREWPPPWPDNSLRAGAIAVKTYAWHRAMPNGARASGSGCFDIYSTTDDQVFDPTFSHANTDQAVNVTFGSVSRKSGQIYLAQYWAGTQGDPCAEVTSGPYAGRMNQWGTVTCANQGMAWPDIVQTFYPTSGWKYLRNLMLNPNAESSAMYAWEWGPNTTVTRGTDDPIEGSYSFHVVGGTNGAFYQGAQFNGSSSTTYHAEARLKCRQTNPGNCSIQMKVIAILANGNTYEKVKSISEPDDGTWRLYTFDPSSFCCNHIKVRLSFVTSANINVDSVELRP
jgi:hypothetical protein